MRRCMVVTVAWMVGVSVTFVSAASAGERVKSAGKDREISFRVTSATPQEGFEHMSVRGGEDVYVSTEVLFTEKQIVSIETVEVGDGKALELTLTPEAVGKLRDAPVRGLAIVSHRRLIAAPQLDSITAEGVARVTGLSVDQVSRLSRMIQAKAAVPIGAILQVVPREANGQAGGVVTVDVFISGISSLRTYQVALDATGGQGGSLTREDAWIDTDRADYVFGAAEAIKAVDDVHGRIGAVLFDGDMDAIGPKYLGTYTFRASNDAGGTFTITARLGRDTFLSDPEHMPIPFDAQGASIDVIR